MTKLIIFKRFSISFTKYTTDVRLIGWDGVFGDLYCRGFGSGITFKGFTSGIETGVGIIIVRKGVCNKPI
jgi:hypothetical protein